MSDTRPDLPLLLQAFASFAMTGLIWFVHIRTAAWTGRSVLLLIALRGARS